MSSTTQIEWTDATWNPVTGCTKITRGCDLCYAERFSERFRGVPGHPFEKGFDLTLRPERLTQPLRWRQPKRIFVNSMSDLFHKEVPRQFIDAVFDTMEISNWHIPDLFPGHHAQIKESTIDEIVDEQKAWAATELLATLRTHGALPFSDVVVRLLQPYMLRETNVKDICVELAKGNKIENTWGPRSRKPQNHSIIELK